MKSKHTIPRRSPQHGFALIAVLIIVVVLAAVLAGVMYSTVSERKNSASDNRKNFAFYAAEAGMEKLTADLGTLYNQQKSPTVAQIQALAAAANQPNIAAATYSEYNIVVTASKTNPILPASNTQNISSGPNAGLIAQVVPLTLQVTANSTIGEQVRMIRNVEVALIPVFQFGVFSDSDVSFFPGPTFDFNGRVFTNGNLYLNAQNGPLTFHSKVSAVLDIVRQSLSNGVNTTGTRTQAVNIPTAPKGCDAPAPACRNLQLGEGSSSPLPQNYPVTPGAYNNNWVNISTKTYGLNLQNGKTGTKPLTLSFVQAGVTPYEIIRRPPQLPIPEDPTGPTGTSRLYTQAQIRILLDDNAANFPGGLRGTDVQLGVAPGNVGNLLNPTYGGAVTGVVGAQTIARGIQSQKATGGLGCIAKGTCTGWDQNWFNPHGVDVLADPWPLVSGWLRVEYRKGDGTYQDVTQEWLTLGFARGAQVPNAENGVANTVHPNAILDFQFPADNIATPVAPYKYYPINLYDPREGEVRDVVKGSDCAVAGVINVVELDMLNLRRWLAGNIGANGAQVESTTQNGYIVYFSDRRGMQLAPAMGPIPAALELNGEYGFEDVINPADVNGKPNGKLDAGEDANTNGVLDSYGVATIGNGFGLAAANVDPYSTRIANCTTVARSNEVTGPRHAVKVINGSLGNLPVSPAGGGVTVASENPVYVQGNYNANNAGFGANGEVAAAVIADAVTLLSTQYTDLRGFQNPTQRANRPAAQTYYRLAIAGGKNISFPQPQAWAAAEDYGTDGGVHNFLRYLEDWGGQTSNYQGSLVSLYFSRQGVGVFKCCNTVYGAPNRNYSFDTNFLDPAKLPPGTPRFQDIDNLGYHQDYAPQ